MNQYPPSLLASAAIYLALTVMKSPKQVSVWTPLLQSETGYYSVDLNGCAQNYFKLATLIQKSSLQTVMKKFSSSSYISKNLIFQFLFFVFLRFLG